jgi:glycosyltransferase involved in cell wall biosynthesis
MLALNIFAGLLTLCLTFNLLKNLKKNNTLSRGQYVEEFAKNVTLAIPCRNEYENLKDLLPRIVDQRSRPFEVQILDDGSSDGTSVLVKSFSQKYPWIKLVNGKSLPLGWKGKVWALDQLLNQVQSPYVLFMDADVKLVSASALGSLFKTSEGIFKNNEKSFISLFPRPKVSFTTGLLVHQIQTFLNYFLPYDATKLPFNNTSAVAGCGQVMIFNSDWFKSQGGFKHFKSSTHDGLLTARFFAKMKNPVFTFAGGDLFTSQTYQNFASAFSGFSRNSFEATNSVTVTFIFCLALLMLFVWPLFQTEYFFTHPILALPWALMLFGQIKLARRYDVSIFYVFLTPVGAILSVTIQIWGMLKTKFHIPTLWRGRQVKLMALIPYVALSQFQISDQFDRRVDWQKFEGVPIVLIIGGRNASERAAEWGVLLENEFNAGFIPTSSHLQSLNEEHEKIKIIGVATLPNVPSIFKGIFRNGFRSSVKDFGLALDFSSLMSKAFDYNEKKLDPKIVVVTTKHKVTAIDTKNFSAQEIIAKMKVALR